MHGYEERLIFQSSLSVDEAKGLDFRLVRLAENDTRSFSHTAKKEQPPRPTSGTADMVPRIVDFIILVYLLGHAPIPEELVDGVSNGL